MGHWCSLAIMDIEYKVTTLPPGVAYGAASVDGELPEELKRKFEESGIVCGPGAMSVLFGGFPSLPTEFRWPPPSSIPGAFPPKEKHPSRRSTYPIQLDL